jgi:very-short-patch-repair endonuclease
LFIAKSVELLKSEGIHCLLFQNSFLADTACKNIRRYLLESTKIITIDSFPERDNVYLRVFENVKMSVAILLLKKQLVLPSDDYIFRLNTWADKFMLNPPNKIDFKRQDIFAMDSVTFQIPSILETEKDLLFKIKNEKQFQIECFEGEINMTFHRKHMNTNPKNLPVIKGAGIQRYYTTSKMSQGILEYLDSASYHKENKGKKSQHHKQSRIAMQGITGVDDKKRIIATIIDKNNYLANSCNYILKQNNYNLEYILGLFNSTLFNWIFKKTSTNSNVNCYEVEALQFRLDSTLEAPIVQRVAAILALTQGLPHPKGEGVGKETVVLEPSPLGRGQGEGTLDVKETPFTIKTKLNEAFLQRVKELRRNQTDAENFLWQLLRNRQFFDKKFKRQEPFPPYIVDFYCHEEKIVIELDGGQHADPQAIEYDQARTTFLESKGLTVLRFWNNDIFKNTEGVLETIYQHFSENLGIPHPNLLPKGEGTVALEPSPLGRGQGEGAIPKGEGVPTITQLEAEIDVLVYQLYNLTYAEVLVVQPDFPLSQSTYEAGLTAMQALATTASPIAPATTEPPTNLVWETSALATQYELQQ